MPAVFQCLPEFAQTQCPLSQDGSTIPVIWGKEWRFHGLPGSLAGKEYASNAGDPGSIPGSGRSLGEGIGHPLQYSCLENPHGQRSQAGYSP